MLGYIILSIFIVLIVLVIYKEYKNEKRYESERSKQRPKSATRETPRSRRELTEKEKRELLQKRKPTAVTQSKKKLGIEEKTIKKEVIATKLKPTKKLPTCSYPSFTHVRLIEMGLSDEEAIEFVEELILQIENQIPLIEKVLEASDFHQMERLTHSIKGSATNIGTGGISDLLVECNTYLKSGTDKEISTVYFKALVNYTQNLKTQYI